MPSIVVLPDPSRDASILFPRGITIGRAATNDVCLDDPMASRYHFHSGPENGDVVLYDGQTPNGTFVDGIARIRYVTKGGERIQCGGTAILYLRSEDSPESLATIIDDEGDQSRNLVTLRVYDTVRDKGPVFFGMPRRASPGSSRPECKFRFR